MDNEIVPDVTQFSKFKDRVVVLTGGANGIGSSTVRLLYNVGAFVIFGDLATSAAEALMASLNHPARVTFVLADTSSYSANMTLFRVAHQKYGRVDHAIACAGISEQGKWFDPMLTMESVAEEPTTKVLDVNLKGVLFFARIAVVFLREGKGSEDRSLTLLSSVAGFRESPGLTIYQCSKHGIMGLMRTLRNVIYPRDGIRINVICPGMTDTNMAASIIEAFRSTQQAINTAEDVARMILALGVMENMNGKAVCVVDGRGWEIEDGVDRTMPQWLGEEPAHWLRDGFKQIAQLLEWRLEGQMKMGKKVYLAAQDT